PAAWIRSMRWRPEIRRPGSDQWLRQVVLLEKVWRLGTSPVSDQGPGLAARGPSDRLARTAGSALRAGIGIRSGERGSADRAIVARVLRDLEQPGRSECVLAEDPPPRPGSPGSGPAGTGGG